MEDEIIKKQSKSNEKRLQSLKILKKNYQNQKSIIKSALSNVDKPNKKIIFDEGIIKDAVTSSSNLKKSQGKSLFDDESDDDRDEIDFSVKKQFEGEKGHKLLELQSRYKNDKRFILNEHFLDDPSNDTAENGFGGNEDQEMSLEQEKKREYEILNEVLEKHQLKPKLKPNTEGEKKMMVRFDPTQPEHLKYEIKKDEISSKNKKKEKTKKIEGVLKEKKFEETETPEVSKNVFYQVKGSLKDSLQENKQISLLSMFGQVNEDGVDDIHEEEKNEEMEVKITKPSIKGERNPFRYDSSEDEEEKDIPHEDDGLSKKNSEDAPVEKNINFWVETFFFKEDDYRLQEGFDFLEKTKMEDQSDFAKTRRELRGIVRTKVRNVQQKKKPFKRKLGGSKRRKDIRIKKALKK